MSRINQGDKANLDQWFTEDNTPDPKEPPIPCGHRVLIRPLAIQERTSGGIILPDSTKDSAAVMMTIGRVLDFGPTAWTRDDYRVYNKEGESVPWARTGDYVLYGRFSGLKLECEGVKLIIVNDDEVIAIITNTKNIKR